MEVQFEGMTELMNQLESLAEKSDEAAEATLLKAGEFLQNEVKKRTPVKTGNLQRHIQLSKVENNEIEVYVDHQGKAYYGVMLEEGTSKMSAQPYMYPAFQANRRKIELTMINELRFRLGLSE